MNNKYQDFLTTLQEANESERDWLVMEFSLQNLSEVLRQAVWVAAIPHWFDFDYLNAVLGNPLKQADFQALTELSFVEVFPDRGFNVHERSRKLLLDRLWANNKTRYQKLSKRAASYCKKQDQNIEYWFVEMIYHGLVTDNVSTLNRFVKQAIDWNNTFQKYKLANLTQAAMEAIDRNKLNSEESAYIYVYKGISDSLEDKYDSAKICLELALKQKIKNPALKAECLFQLGKANLYLNSHSNAHQLIQKALECFQKIENRLGEANCHQSFGLIYDYLAESEQVIDSFQKALQIYKEINDELGQANCYRSLGGNFFRLAEYKHSLNNYHQALTNYKKINSRLGEANCISGIGRVHTAQKEIELAIEIFQQAILIYEEIGCKRGKSICLEGLFELYRTQKNFNLSLSFINDAIQLLPNENNFINRAGLFIQMENYEKAEADIKEAEKIGNNCAFTLMRKAELLLWQQQPKQAIELCKQGLAIRPASGEDRATYSLTLFADGQTELAYSEMSEALTKLYQLQSFDDLLEDFDKLAKIYGHSSELEFLREQVIARRTQQANKILAN